MVYILHTLSIPDQVFGVYDCKIHDVSSRLMSSTVFSSIACRQCQLIFISAAKLICLLVGAHINMQGDAASRPACATGCWPATSLLSRVLLVQHPSPTEPRTGDQSKFEKVCQSKLE